MSDVSPEIQAAFDALVSAASGMERAANTMLSALADARCVGADLRQSDIDIIKTRYLVQIPYALRFTAGQLLPPITGTLNITLDDASVKNGGG